MKKNVRKSFNASEEAHLLGIVRNNNFSITKKMLVKAARLFGRSNQSVYNKWLNLERASGKSPGGIKLFTIETNVTPPARGTHKEIEEIQGKLRPIIPKVKVGQCIAVPAKRRGSISNFIKKEFPQFIFHVVVVKDNPAIARAFRKK